jgi:hypothetical protein
MRILLIFFSFLVVTQVAANVLSWDGFGNITFGETLEEISTSTGLKFAPTNDAIDWEEACKYVDVKGQSSIHFMVEEGILTRADAPVGTPTVLNIDVSGSLDEIKRQHPNAIIKNHKYAMDGHYIIFYNADKSKAILFEHYESKIQVLRAGLVPSVLYVEGCL